MRTFMCVLILSVLLVVWECAAEHNSDASKEKDDEQKNAQDTTTTSTKPLQLDSVQSELSESAPVSQPTAESKIVLSSAERQGGEDKGSGANIERTLEATDLGTRREHERVPEVSTTTPEAQKVSGGKEGLHRESDNGVLQKTPEQLLLNSEGHDVSALQQSPQPQPQSRRPVVDGEGAEGRSTATASTGTSGAAESRGDAMRLRDAPKSTKSTSAAAIPKKEPHSTPAASEPLVDPNESKLIKKTPELENLEEGTAATNRAPTEALSTDVSPNKKVIGDKKKPLEIQKITDRRPKAQISTDVSHPTRTETEVTVSHEVPETIATAADTTTTTVSAIGTERKVDTITSLPIDSNALPLHNSVEKTDGSLGSSSLFAIAALATLAVAAAAPAH